MTSRDEKIVRTKEIFEIYDETYREKPRRLFSR